MADRKFYEPEGGEALDKDNNVFDVTEWRKRGDWGDGGINELLALQKLVLEENKLTNKLLRKILDNE